MVACTPQEAAAPQVREAAPAPEGRQFPEQLAGLQIAKMDWRARLRSGADWKAMRRYRDATAVQACTRIEAAALSFERQPPQEPDPHYPCQLLVSMAQLA
jgi:hypothetical protein